MTPNFFYRDRKGRKHIHAHAIIAIGIIEHHMSTGLDPSHLNGLSFVNGRDADTG